MKTISLKKYLLISTIFSFVLILVSSICLAQKVPPPKDFFASGLLVKVAFDQNHPIAYGMPKEAAGFFAFSPTFQILPVLKEQEKPAVVGKYAEENIILSGWMLGEKYLKNKAAVVEVPFGKGKIILLGFRVQHRGQTKGTFRLLFNSVFYGAIK